MGRSTYLVHRCPRCKSRAVKYVAPKEKSTLQKGLEMAGAFAEGYFIGTDGSITEWISNSINDPSKQDKFFCSDCQHSWKIANMVDETPIEVLEKEKKERISQFRSNAALSILGTVVLLAVTVWSFHYCWVNDFTSTHINNTWLFGDVEVTDYHWSWLFVGILFLVSLGFTFACFCRVMDNFEKIKVVRKMDIETFRNSRKYRPL